MPAIKLFAFKAPSAPILAILRRGTVKTVFELLVLNLETRVLTAGQFMTRKTIFAKGATISPDGRFFALTFDTTGPSGHPESHTILTELPNFTAIFHSQGAGRLIDPKFTRDGRFVPTDIATHRLTDHGKTLDQEALPRVVPHNQVRSEEIQPPTILPFAEDGSVVFDDVERSQRVRLQEGRIFINDELFADLTTHQFVNKAPTTAIPARRAESPVPAPAPAPPAPVLRRSTRLATQRIA